MMLEIPAHLSDEVHRLVNDHGYTPEAAVAKAARAAVERHKPRRATKGPQPDPDTARRTPARHSAPDDAGISPQNEKQFTQMVLYAFRMESWLCYHTFNSRKSEPGFPDIVAVHAEHGTIFAELKMPRGRVSNAQQRWLDMLTETGQRVYLWYPHDWDDIEAIAKGKAA